MKPVSRGWGAPIREGIGDTDHGRRANISVCLEKQFHCEPGCHVFILRVVFCRLWCTFMFFLSLCLRLGYVCVFWLLRSRHFVCSICLKQTNQDNTELQFSQNISTWLVMTLALVITSQHDACGLNHYYYHYYQHIVIRIFLCIIRIQSYYWMQMACWSKFWSKNTQSYL